MRCAVFGWVTLFAGRRLRAAPRHRRGRHVRETPANLQNLASASRLPCGRGWQLGVTGKSCACLALQTPVPAQSSGRTQDRCFAADQSVLHLCLVRGSELPAEPPNRG